MRKKNKKEKTPFEDFLDSLAIFNKLMLDICIEKIRESKKDIIDAKDLELVEE